MFRFRSPQRLPIWMALEVVLLATASSRAFAFADPCADTTKAVTLASKNINITTMTPSGGFDSTVASILVTGSGLKDLSVHLCPQHATAAAQYALTKSELDPQHPSTDKKLYAVVTIYPGVEGIFNVYLRNSAGELIDAEKTFVITLFKDADYTNCTLFIIFGSSSNPNVDCSFVPLSYNQAKHAFGKGVADMFVVVQVTVRNKNADLEFLLQDVRLGTQGLVFGSFDKKIPRAIAQKAEQFTARAIVFRLVEAGSTALTGIAGVVDNELLKDASNLVAGPVQTGLRNSIPDLSVKEISLLDDMGFSVSSTVVPKNGALAFVAFLSSEAFAPENFSNVKRDKLIDFQRGFRVQIAGKHVLPVDLNRPTLKGFIPPNTSTTVARERDVDIVVQGTALTSLTSLSFQHETQTNQTFTLSLQSLTGQTTLDPNVDKVTIPKDRTLIPGNYTLSLNTTAGTTITTTLKLPVTENSPPAPAPTAPPPAKPH